MARYQYKLCKIDAHYIRCCQLFKKMSPSERFRIARKYKLCLNCLNAGHGIAKWSSAFNCSICHSRHHFMLHTHPVQLAAWDKNDLTSNPISSKTTPKRTTCGTSATKLQEEGMSYIKSCFTNAKQGNLLGTAQVNIKHCGSIYSARALSTINAQFSVKAEAEYFLSLLEIFQHATFIPESNKLFQKLADNRFFANEKCCQHKW